MCSVSQKSSTNLQHGARSSHLTSKKSTPTHLLNMLPALTIDLGRHRYGVDDDHQVARLLVVAVDLEWSGAHVASVSLQALPLDASSNFGRWAYIDIDRTNYS